MNQPHISADIVLQGLSKRFDKTLVIPDLSAHFRDGEFTVILGPSGCGKSTLLNMIAGLEEVSAGRIRIGDREVQNDEPKNRGIAMVFQNYALYPHMSVANNIGYALKVARMAKQARLERIRAAARVVDLTDYLDRFPSQLSGGQRQRVAIARAIVREPKVLLYDEPLSNLDAKLRHEMRMELSSLHKRIGATSVFVTHDQVEAMTLADRIMILNKGQIEQFDTPDVIYHKPASTFVASFIGAPPMNLIKVRGENGETRLTDGTLLTKKPRSLKDANDCLLGIRPEKISLCDDGKSDSDPVAVDILYREDLGSHTILLSRLPDGQEISITTPLGQSALIGASVRICIKPEHCHFFSPQTGLRLA
ncbi:sn-glycerol-3-phosphate ABC transporter ATP-binding protein UgpC [uncultured Cohaesibacter sp.]|uniref:ABC transporter ATP-binding protein n=1 Tax=uncultured Cohaesibacter sp. TaxID=1002546 RepID=UPI0029C7F30F|nr:sn-glycerol-3-phosphate ABC transporter ATP-binding protein UgpC [uncultured Cohaesibacter sp.]